MSITSAEYDSYCERAEHVMADIAGNFVTKFAVASGQLVGFRDVPWLDENVPLLVQQARSHAIDDCTALVTRWAEDEEVLALEATNDEDTMFYKRCASRHRELAKFVEALKASGEKK